ncbi:hypothetical protein HYU19_01670 [Candidatus Woesearchaeota archaeon]|nr:hypothetical protein [Candidatus Woesearchaeota archaeon]
MDKKIRASVRNGVYAMVILFSFSFLYGGIYTEMIKEGVSFSAGNLLLAFIGALFMSIPLGFIPVFVISLIVYHLRGK